MIHVPWRHWLARSWQLSRAHYWLRGEPLSGQPTDEVWYFAYGANMHDSAFRERRGMRPVEWRAGRIKGYRLRFNLDGRPIGKSTPANVCVDPTTEVWGVLYRITQAGLVHLDATEGRRYRHAWIDAEDIDGQPIKVVTYLASGKPTDGNPSLRYITLLREGAKRHGLPDYYVQYLERIEHAR